jgi:nucleoside-diphosphate-sugar epimerase
MSSPLNMPYREGTRPILMKITPAYCLTRACGVRTSQGDTTALTELGYAPNFTIEEGLRRTLARYRVERSLLGSSVAVPETK